MDKLTAIRAFLAVVDAGGFAKAGGRLGLPKPTVSRMVRMLEDELQLKLLHRTTRHLAVTREGELYYQGAVELLGQLEALESQVCDAALGPRGSVRVEAPSALAAAVLAPALPGFFAVYPEIQLELGISNRSGSLLAENLDCVVRIGPILDDRLVALPPLKLATVACASPAYLAQYGAPRHPEALAVGHVLLRGLSPTTGQPFLRRFQKGEESVEVDGPSPLALNEGNTAVAAARAGLGVAVVFHHLAAPWLASGELIQLFPDWTSQAAIVQVAYLANRRLPRKVRVTVDWLQATIASMAAQSAHALAATASPP